MHFAVQNGDPETVLLLLSRGPNVNAEDHLKNTPLHLVVLKGDMKITRLLLQYDDINIRVNAANDAGNTALHIAAREGNRPMVELLLKHSADIHAKNFSGYTPGKFAQRADIKNILQQQ